MYRESVEHFGSLVIASGVPFPLSFGKRSKARRIGNMEWGVHVGWWWCICILGMVQQRSRHDSMSAMFKCMVSRLLLEASALLCQRLVFTPSWPCLAPSLALPSVLLPPFPNTSGCRSASLDNLGVVVYVLRVSPAFSYRRAQRLLVAFKFIPTLSLPFLRTSLHSIYTWRSPCLGHNDYSASALSRVRSGE